MQICVAFLSVSNHLADAGIAGQDIGILHDGQLGWGGGGDL